MVQNRVTHHKWSAWIKDWKISFIHYHFHVPTLRYSIAIFAMLNSVCKSEGMDSSVKVYMDRDRDNDKSTEMTG